MKAAKSTKEFKTFGILVSGKQNEFLLITGIWSVMSYLLGYTMSFITLELNLSGEYTLIQHESVTTPTFATKAQHMEVYLETIISFKVIFI